MNEPKIEHLWRWFVANEHHITDSFQDESLTDYIVENLNNLILDLGMFTWEIGPGNVKSWYFTISPNGDRDLVKVSQQIMAQAPDMDQWEFNYCRPPKDWDRKFIIYDNNMDEQPVDASSWNYVALPRKNGMLALILEADNVAHLDDDTASRAADLMVTNEIGEENKIRKIASIDIVVQLGHPNEAGKVAIHHLKSHINKVHGS